MPNPNTIAWYHYQDIQIEDVPTRTQFINYMNTGQYNNALVLLASIPETKKFAADTINAITAGIIKLEDFYWTEVTEYLEQLEDQYQEMVVNLENMGQWSADVQYEVLNFVMYNEGAYFCIAKPPIGTLPTDETYWLFIGLRGPQGEPGIDVVYRGEWASGVDYNANDVVVFDNQIWVALKDNTDVIPTTDPATWILLFEIQQGQLWVGPNSPPDDQLAQNVIWIQTESDPLTATTTNPIHGQMYRYWPVTNYWEPMYPNTVHTMIDKYNDYQPLQTDISLTIAESSWNNNSYTYSNSNILDSSVVYILPGTQYNTTQQNVYNSLSITVSIGQIVFTRKEDYNLNLPIRILIQ